MKDVSSKKQRDSAVVLDVIRRFGPVSPIDIHGLTHLRPGTISSLVRELLREERVIGVGLSDDPTGRKQILLQMNGDYGFVAAVEFGAEIVYAAVVNLRGEIRHSVTEAANLENGIDGLVDQLLQVIGRTISEAGVDKRLAAGESGVFEQIVRIARRQALERSTQQIEFRRSELGPEAGVLGLALLLINQYFEIPSLKLPRFVREPAVRPRRCNLVSV